MKTEKLEKEVWIVEYSSSQRAFHINTPSGRDRDELENKRRGHKSDWNVLADNFNTLDEACDWSEQHHPNNKNWKPKF